MRRPSLTRPLRPTVFIECTHTWSADVNTGIQRVVRNVLRNAPAVAAEYGFDAVPVVLRDGRLILADAAGTLAGRQCPAAGSDESAPPGLARRIWRGFQAMTTRVLPFRPVQRFVLASPDSFGLAWCLRLPRRALRWLREMPVRPRAAAVADRPMSLDDFAYGEGSILLLLDSSWGTPIWPAVRRFKAAGGRVVGVIHDLIPITHPQTCVLPLTIAFEDWLRAHLRVTDAFIAVSMAVADQVRQHMRGAGAEVPVGHFHLGSELDLIDPKDGVRDAVRSLFGGPDPVFLMVGSIEPRKNHAFVLDAFDRHWRQGGRAMLIMAGRQGWKTDEVLKRVAAHPENGRKLFLFRDLTDGELAYGYHHASALVIASMAEGFGLPVAEALQRGLPVICSDIPVFREIAGDRATFFSLADPACLAAVIDSFSAGHDPGDRGQRTPQPWLTWRQSTEQMFRVLMTGP